MKLTKSNTEWHRFYDVLNGCLEYKGVLGYGIAKNYRMIGDAIREYLTLYERAFNAYGTQATDKDNRSVLYIAPGSAAHKAFLDEITPIAELANTVDIFVAPMKDAMNNLTSKQMIDLSFMLTDDAMDNV